MYLSKKIAPTLALFAAISVADAASVVFTPNFDADDLPNTSLTIAPYSTTGTDLASGVSDSLMGAAVQIYLFDDNTTGISFELIIIFSASNTMGSTTLTANANEIGAGIDDRISPGETLLLNLSVGNVDTSGYIPNSIPGLSGPVSASVTGAGFDSVTFGSIDAGDSYAISDGLSTLSGQTSGAFNFAAAGFSNASTEFSTTFEPDNGDFSFTGYTPRIELEVIPEPSSVALFGLAGLAALGIRRRK